MAKLGCECCKISNLTDAARRSGSQSDVAMARLKLDKLRRYEGIETLCEDHSERRKEFSVMVEHWLGRVERRHQR